MKIRKVAHCTLIQDEYVGIGNKFESQAKAAAENGIPIDFYWLGGDGFLDPASYQYMKIVRIPGKYWPIVRIRQYLFLKKLLERYDLIILRYPFYDPVLGVIYGVKHLTILEHHTKEGPELINIRSKFRGWIEDTFGSRWIKRFKGIIGVTQEIVDYEVGRSGFTGSTCVVPNGIRVHDFKIHEESRLESAIRPVKAVMTATSFYSWNGVEGIMEAIFDQPIELHLVGELDETQSKLASTIKNVVVHGKMAKSDLLKLYEEMHIGVGSFRLGVKNMTQAVPLKVREYLACGLPVVIGYDDPGIPEDFPYVLRLGENSFQADAVIAFMHKLNGVTRKQVQEKATPFIDIRTQLERLYAFAIEA